MSEENVAVAAEEVTEVENKAEEVVEEVKETMADYEDKLDKDAFEAPVWNKFRGLCENKEIVTVKIENAVKSGVVAFVDGIRGFIPQSHLGMGKIDDLASLAGKEVSVRIIEADQATRKLVLSVREALRDEARKAKKAAAAAVEVGTVLKGKVETLQPYGAFIRLENGLSGLVHVSQIANKRINEPADVLKIDDEVDVKVIAVKDGKLSLSIKALLEEVFEGKEKKEKVPRAERPAKEDKVEIPKAENIATSLGDMLKGFKL